MIVISLALAVLGVVLAVVSCSKIPDSLSALAYLLPYGGQWEWTMWAWFISLGMCIPLITSLPETWQFLGFLTLACLMLCGAMPISDANVCKRAHDILGIAGGILSQVCVAVLNSWWLMVWALWIILMGCTVIQSENGNMRRLFSGKGVFIAEVICLSTLAGVLLT